MKQKSKSGSRPEVQFTPPVNKYSAVGLPTSFITAKTVNQKKYIRAICENDITLCSGPSGTGKSVVALGIALEHILSPNHPQNKLYITRPMVATSTRDFPWIKGSLLDKLVPYFAPILNNLESLLGSKKRLEDLIEREVINLQATELMRGFTYKDCYVIATETQNLTVPQAVMMVTRLGENCKMVIEGDTDQKDIREYDGLSYLKSRIGPYTDLCGYVEMGKQDIVRHPLIGKILDTIDYKGAGYQYDERGVTE